MGQNDPDYVLSDKHFKYIQDIQMSFETINLVQTFKGRIESMNQELSHKDREFYKLKGSYDC